MCFSDDELEGVKQAVTALKPFPRVTEEMSSEKVTTLSKVIPLTRLLLTRLLLTKACSMTDIPLAQSLQRHMLARKFEQFETFHPLNQATLIDPRLKKIAFKETSNLEYTKEKLIEEVTAMHLPVSMSTDTPEASTVASSSTADDLWTDFDADVTASMAIRTTQVDSHLEVQRDLEDNNIQRGEDPLAYWRQNDQSLKRLSEMAKK